jgi:hypothetical protein
LFATCIPAISLAATCYSQGGPYYSEATYYTQTSYYSQGTYGTTSPQTKITSSASTTAFTTLGSIFKGSGTFVIDHPLDPRNKLLYHSFVESPDAKNMYDGVAKLDDEGEATLTLPRYFTALNKDFRYQLKPIGQPMPELHVKDGIINGRLTVGGGKPGGRVSWQVTGTRKDPYITANPIIPEVRKGDGQLRPVGEFQHEDIYPTSIFPPLTDLLNRFRDWLYGDSAEES